MATTTKQVSSFDFDAFNALMKTANSGLQLFLAERMLQDVQGVMLRYRSPLIKDMTDIVDELAQLRADNKKYLATRENRGTDDTALTPQAHSTSADAGKVA
jgi:hypothetical protein